MIAHRDVAEVWNLDPPTWQPSAALVELGAHEQRLLDSLFDSLRAAQDTFDGSAAAYHIMELLVGAVATQLAAIHDHDRSADDSTSELTRAFLTAVASTGKARTVDEVASTLGYSPRHLTRTVRRDTGRPPGAWLHDRTLLEAKRLLAHTDLTAAAVGARLGFVDASHFSRAFKRGTGHTASSFRKAHRVH